jgi:hypothetical protein
MAAGVLLLLSLSLALIWLSPGDERSTAPLTHPGTQLQLTL